MQLISLIFMIFSNDDDYFILQEFLMGQLIIWNSCSEVDGV